MSGLDYFQRTIGTHMDAIQRNIVKHGKSMTYDEIIADLKIRSCKTDGIRYSATETISERLDHLRAKGVLTFDYQTKKYSKAQKSFRQKKRFA